MVYVIQRCDSHSSAEVYCIIYLCDIVNGTNILLLWDVFCFSSPIFHANRGFCLTRSV